MPRILFALGAAVALAASAVNVPATASPAADALVISEVYGAGGNAGAVFANDFVELYNPTGGAISVDGMAIKYLPASPSTASQVQVARLVGSVAARGRYLVQLAGGTNTSLPPLPTPDATSTINMAATAGQVWLASDTSTTRPPANIVDFVGFGSAVTYEGNGPAAAPSAVNATARNARGTDTDDNRADFTAGAPTPQNSGAVIPPEDPPGPAEKSIAEVQGTGPVSALLGETVTVKGVVTAAYPTGGFNGFFMQTPGTGTKAGEASHGIFVFGSSATAKVAVGDYVQVVAKVAEYQGLTQLTPASAADVQVVSEQVPAPTALATGWPASTAEREALEGMLLAPTGPFTVTDNYSVNNFAEIGIAAGTEPLRQPTDVAPYGSAEAQAVAAHNAAARVTLDDGASINFLGAAANKNIALPWLTDDPTIRVGEAVTFTKPVVLDYRFNTWRFQPTAQLTAGDSFGVLPATFSDTRTAKPAPVGGDIQVASFNVLNYFPTTGEDLTGCTYYTDRVGNPVTISGGCNARGAAEKEDFQRQQAKIVTAINALGAEVVSLEEIENSAQFKLDRDRALANLVAALNAEAGAGTWDYVRSPLNTPDVTREDFIRTGFIYQPAAVTALDGQGWIYDGDEFDRARDPLAQVFMPKRGNAKDKFILIVNHFKSKGSAPAAPDPDADYGQGGFNALRTAQAKALVAWAEQLKASTKVPKVYLDGDFNSYTFEDPMQVLYDAGYVSLERRFQSSPTYLFGGLVGSLDHGLANAAALGTTSGATVWNINSVESVALEYSRFNYNATNFFDPATPYRSSDHDPVVFGIRVTKGRG